MPSREKVLTAHGNDSECIILSQEEVEAIIAHEESKNLKKKAVKVLPNDSVATSTPKCFSDKQSIPMKPLVTPTDSAKKGKSQNLSTTQMKRKLAIQIEGSPTSKVITLSKKSKTEKRTTGNDSQKSEKVSNQRFIGSFFKPAKVMSLSSLLPRDTDGKVNASKSTTETLTMREPVVARSGKVVHTKKRNTAVIPNANKSKFEPATKRKLDSDMDIEKLAANTTTGAIIPSSPPPITRKDLTPKNEPATKRKLDSDMDIEKVASNTTSGLTISSSLPSITRKNVTPNKEQATNCKLDSDMDIKKVDPNATTIMAMPNLSPPVIRKVLSPNNQCNETEEISESQYKKLQKKSKTASEKEIMEIVLGPQYGTTAVNPLLKSISKNDDVHDLLPHLLAWEETESFLPVKIPKKKIVTCKNTQTALSESNGKNNEKVENKQHIASSLKHSCKDETVKLIPGSKVIEKEVTGEKEDGVVHISTAVGKNEKAELDIVKSKLKDTSNVDLSSKDRKVKLIELRDEKGIHNKSLQTACCFEEQAVSNVIDASKQKPQHSLTGAHSEKTKIEGIRNVATELCDVSSKLEREKNEKIHQSKVIEIDSLSSQIKPIELESHNNNTLSPNKSSTNAFESQVSTKKCIISKKLGDDLNTNKKVSLEIFQNSLPQVSSSKVTKEKEVNILQPRKQSKLKPGSMKIVKLDNALKENKESLHVLPKIRNVEIVDEKIVGKEINQCSTSIILKPGKKIVVDNGKITGENTVDTVKAHHAAVSKLSNTNLGSPVNISLKGTPPRKTKSNLEEAIPNEKKIEPYTLTDGDTCLISKHHKLRVQYRKRADELAQRFTNGTLPEEEFQQKSSTDSDNVVDEITLKSTNNGGEFKDEWLPILALLIQGSPLPLNTLARKARKHITKVFNGTNIDISIDTVATKIKLISSRKHYLLPLPPDKLSTSIDIFTNVDPNLMWRWELISLDLLPEKYINKVKIATRSRKKLQYHQKAIVRLLVALDVADSHIISGPSLAQDRKKQALARVSNEEEKVLKYERDEIKAQLLHDAKVNKEKEKVHAQLEKQKEKERIEEGKRKEKALRDEEKENKKKESAQLKKKKEVEKKKKEVEELQAKEEVEKKRKARMISFFKAPASPVIDSCTDTVSLLDNKLPQNDCSDLSMRNKSTVTSELINASPGRDDFWKLINSCNYHSAVGLFSKPSKKASLSRKRKISKTKVRVFITVAPDNPFEQQPYDDERILTIRNKNKFLSFHGDHRPPYYGTWSKPSSSIINGRNPFGKDKKYLDYDVDSEAEWEEDIDEEHGENCSEDGNEEEEMDDEEVDNRVYNYQDGWLAQDDDLGLEEEDDETKAMRKKKNQTSDIFPTQLQGQEIKKSRACVLAPLAGGIPIFNCADSCPELVSELIHGVRPNEAKSCLLSHAAEVVSPSMEFCFDAFPPSEENEKNANDFSISGVGTSTGKTGTNQEMSKEDLKIFVKFVHNCTLNSKEKIVEDLRLTHSNVIKSRAHAVRKLDSIATKRRVKKRGVVWEVKNDLLKSLGLDELINVPTSILSEDSEKATEQLKKTDPPPKKQNAKQLEKTE